MIFLQWISKANCIHLTLEKLASYRRNQTKTKKKDERKLSKKERDKEKRSYVWVRGAHSNTDQNLLNKIKNITDRKNESIFWNLEKF